MNKTKIITNIMLSLLGISAITSTTVLATNDSINEVKAKTNLLSNSIKRANELKPIWFGSNFELHYLEGEYSVVNLKKGQIIAFTSNVSDAQDEWDLNVDDFELLTGYQNQGAIVAGHEEEYLEDLREKYPALNDMYDYEIEDWIGHANVIYLVKNNTHMTLRTDWAFYGMSTETVDLTHHFNIDHEENYIVLNNEDYEFHRGDIYISDPRLVDYEIDSYVELLDESDYSWEIDQRSIEEAGYSEYFNDFDGLTCVFYVDRTFTYHGSAYLIKTMESLDLPDLQEPTISGENHFVINVNNPLSKEEILSHISAYDETDGKVDVVFDSCDYDPSNLSLGQFDAVVSATDKSGNKATVNITINVVDIDKPVINGTNSYEVSYDEPLTLDSIKEALSITDNFEKDLVLNLVEDNYTDHEREVGEHTVIFNAKDSSDNVSDNYIVTIKVVDKKVPVITAPKTITAGNDKMVSLDEIKAKISVNDGLDGNIDNYDISGFDNYETNYKKVGNYVLTVKASDKSGNQATFEITINVEDRIAPDIYFDDYFIVVPQGQELSKEQIYEMASKVLNIAVTEFSSLEGEYDTAVAGKYKLTLKTINNESYNFTLSVEANYEDTTQYRDLAWYEYIYIWFSIFFNFQDGYETESFWDFGMRCSYISEVYSSGKIKVTEQVNDEVVSDVEALPNDEESTN